MKRLPYILAAVTFLATAWILLGSSSAPILGDYAEWTYHAVLLRDLLQIHPNPAYLLKPYPVPNSLTTLALGLLMLALPWKLAAKLWLLCELLLGLIAVVTLQRASAATQPWTLPILLPAMILGIPFWAGFTNFAFALYLTFILCALLLRAVESSWLYALVLTLIFFSHMVPFAFALLTFTLYALQIRRPAILLQAIPSLILTAWYIFGRAAHADADGKAGMLASIPYTSPLFALFKINTFLKCWGFLNPAVNEHDSILLRLLGPAAFILLFLLSTTVALTLLALLLRTAIRSLRASSPQRFLWIAILLFFAASFLLPGAAFGISDPGGRTMQVAVWTAACLLTTHHRWLSTVLSTCGLTLLAVDLYLLAAVAMHPVAVGVASGPLPAHLREFAHVYYADRAVYYDAIDTGIMDKEIYPTALFLKKAR